MTTRRRQFLKAGLAAAAGAAALPEALHTQAGGSRQGVSGFELDEATLETLRQGMESHGFAPRLKVLVREHPESDVGRRILMRCPPSPPACPKPAPVPARGSAFELDTPPRWHIDMFLLSIPVNIESVNPAGGS